MATFAIVAGTGILPLAVLYPLFYIQSTTVTTNCCPTQSWNMWAIGYTKISTRDYMKQTLVYALPTALILRLSLTLCLCDYGEAAAAGSLPPHRNAGTRTVYCEIEID